jgi:hypothetical protein
MSERITTKDLHNMARAYLDALIAAGVYPADTALEIHAGSVTYGRGYGFTVTRPGGRYETMAGANSAWHLPCNDARRLADNYYALRALLAGVQAVTS